MKEKITFETSMDRLGSIVKSLENNEIPLNEAMKLFEEGLKLVDACEGELKAFDEQINGLMKNVK